MQPVVIRGAGDLATGVALRLCRARLPVVMLELPEPLAVRRTVAFAEAIPLGRWEVEGVAAVRVLDAEPARAARAAREAIAAGEVPVAVDPDGALVRELRPTALVDATLAKRNQGTRITDAPVVIALGPGFTAGVDCHAVIETQRGHRLGRVIYRGAAEPDTGLPAPVRGVAGERVVRAPVTGRFTGSREIGEMVAAGAVLGEVAPDAGGAPPVPVVAATAGVLRGLLRSGVQVRAGTKVGDIDPTGDRTRCFTVSDKALAVGGGVLEALLALWPGGEVALRGG